MGWEPKQPQSILQATRLPPAPGPGVPWSTSWPGCARHPQAPQQAGADETCSSAGRSQAAGREEAPSHHAAAEVTAREETLAKAQSRERTGDPGCGAGATAAVPVPKGWAEIGWHLVTGGLKSIFNSQELKPLAAAIGWGSPHPYGPGRGARAPQHSRGAWGWGVGPCPHPSPARWRTNPSDPTLGFCMRWNNRPAKASVEQPQPCAASPHHPVPHPSCKSTAPRCMAKPRGTLRGAWLIGEAPFPLDFPFLLQTGQ